MKKETWGWVEGRDWFNHKRLKTRNQRWEDGDKIINK